MEFDCVGTVLIIAFLSTLRSGTEKFFLLCRRCCSVLRSLLYHVGSKLINIFLLFHFIFFLFLFFLFFVCIPSYYDVYEIRQNSLILF